MIPLHDLIGHLAYITILGGTLCIGSKRKIGWFMRMIGDLVWVGIGWHLGLTSVMLWSSIFAVNEIYNYRKWNKKNENK